MSSIIEGYNYDIFISYRQKDNKGGRQGALLFGATQSRETGWVSEFVEALKTELESTFKEEISVYFDINPHDGLLETHDVDASLKDKLKCLVFIPIISRTYCDPKSFAWEHEFKTFVEQASQDQFGLKVKLPNGNVASRVLPIRIYDLDSADIKLFETVLDGVLRGIEFIYKSAGVNRPLTPSDNPDKNLYKTFYRDQINKVGNAIKELISGLKIEPKVEGEESIHNKPYEEAKKEEAKEIQEIHTKLSKRKLLTGGSLLTLFLIIAAILVYPKIFKRNTLEELRSSGKRISIAVMPFQNMTNDTIWNVWQNGIQDMMISFLSNFPEELIVRQAEFINGLLQKEGFHDYASVTPAAAGKIAQKLESNIYIRGSIKQAGNKIRLNTQLFDIKTQTVLKSFETETTSDEKEIFYIIDTLNQNIRDFLIISFLGKSISPDMKSALNMFGSTKNPEAYRCYIYGINATMKLNFSTAVNMLSQAVSIDSNFLAANLLLALFKINTGQIEEGRELFMRKYKQKDLLPLKQKMNLNILYSNLFEGPQEIIQNHREVLAIDDQDPLTHGGLAGAYSQLEQYDNAIPEFEREIEIYESWDSIPSSALYAQLGFAYHKTNQYKKEQRLYNKADHLYHGIDSYKPLIITSASLDFRQAVLYLAEGKKKKAEQYINKHITDLKAGLFSEGDINTNIGSIYWESGILDKAEEYLRKARSMEPENPGKMNTLAYFLIDKEININEGMELIDKALESNPDNYDWLDTKGWGLYKLGKYQEAMKLLQKADSLKPIYSQDIYMHLEAAKKAVASQKNN